MGSLGGGGGGVGSLGGGVGSLGGGGEGVGSCSGSSTSVDCVSGAVGSSAIPNGSVTAEVTPSPPSPPTPSPKSPRRSPLTTPPAALSSLDSPNTEAVVARRSSVPPPPNMSSKLYSELCGRGSDGSSSSPPISRGVVSVSWAEPAPKSISWPSTGEGGGERGCGRETVYTRPLATQPAREREREGERWFAQ